MNEKIDCEIIRDLLPGYIEKVTSKVTNDAVEKHLNECNECNEYYKNMSRYINVENFEDIREEHEVKHIFKKAKKIYILKGIFIAAGILSVVIPFIVDLCVNSCLTWFYIVFGGCILAYSVLGILIFNNSNKIFNVLLAVSMEILPYLYIIQIVCNKYFLVEKIYWFKNLALPITIIWLIILWISFFVYIKFNKNVFFSLGTMLICSSAGAVFTNFVVAGYAGCFDSIQDNKISCILYLLAGIILLYIGKKRYVKK